MYLIRLDDASEYMDVEKWNKLEVLLDKYDIKPIVGIIPINQDAYLLGKYKKNYNFWDKVHIWNSKKWTLALHGCTHVYSSKSGGINPVNYKSEFAGLSLNEQKEKIKHGIQVFQEHGLVPQIFFAPSHTFDMNTLEALKYESKIRIICDTVANDIYKMDEFYFIPQQSGHVRSLPFKITTFCYHPNNMNKTDFALLKCFIEKYKNKFTSFDDLTFSDRKFNLFDVILRKMYFSVRSIRKIFRKV